MSVLSSNFDPRLSANVLISHSKINIPQLVLAYSSQIYTSLKKIDATLGEFFLSGISCTLLVGECGAWKIKYNEYARHGDFCFCLALRPFCPVFFKSRVGEPVEKIKTPRRMRIHVDKTRSARFGGMKGYNGALWDI